MAKVVPLVVCASPLVRLRSSLYASLLTASRDPLVSLGGPVVLRLYILYIPVVPVKRPLGVVWVNSDSDKAALDSWVSIVSKMSPPPFSLSNHTVSSASNAIKRLEKLDVRVYSTSLPYSADSNAAVHKLVEDVIDEGIKKKDWDSYSFILLPSTDFGFARSFLHGDLKKNLNYCDVTFGSSSSVIWVDTNPSSFRKALEDYIHYSDSRRRSTVHHAEVANAKVGGEAVHEGADGSPEDALPYMGGDEFVSTTNNGRETGGDENDDAKV